MGGRRGGTVLGVSVDLRRGHGHEAFVLVWEDLDYLAAGMS